MQLPHDDTLGVDTTLSASCPDSGGGDADPAPRDRDAPGGAGDPLDDELLRDPDKVACEQTKHVTNELTASIVDTFGLAAHFDTFEPREARELAVAAVEDLVWRPLKRLHWRACYAESRRLDLERCWDLHTSAATAELRERLAQATDNAVYWEQQADRGEAGQWRRDFYNMRDERDRLQTMLGGALGEIERLKSEIERLKRSGTR